MTTLPSFPVLAGQGWSIHKKPTFSTLVASHVSGREVRDALYANPIWSFEVTFNGLDGTASGQYGGLGAASLQSLMGLFLQCQGQFSSFIYFDPTDYQVSGKASGPATAPRRRFSLCVCSEVSASRSSSQSSRRRHCSSPAASASRRLRLRSPPPVRQSRLPPIRSRALAAP